MEHKKSKFIPLSKVFALQNGAMSFHLKNNKLGFSFIQHSIELCLNRNSYCSNSLKCNKESLKTFEVVFQEIISSLIVAYRVGLWGSTTDCYAILRNVLEGLGFINEIVKKGDFKDIFKLMEKDKLKKKYIKQRVNQDKLLCKTIGKLSDLASHFTQKRMAQRVFTLNGKQFARIGTAVYEKDNELTNRLGQLINTAMYAIGILKDFYQKYHSDCVNEEFYKKFNILNRKYEKIVLCQKQKNRIKAKKH